ncbi:MAG: hypothetical protein R2795_07370 [Saprospiraceae bacterium]
MIPHRDDVLLEGMDIFQNFLVLSERKNGITQIRVRPWDGKKEHYINFGEDAYLAYTTTNIDFDTDVAAFGLSVYDDTSLYLRLRYEFRKNGTAQTARSTWRV